MKQLTRIKKWTFLILVLSVLSVRALSQSSTPKPGILDLSKKNLSEQKIPLNGSWAFYWKRLLPPELISRHQPDVYPKCPELWSNIIIHGTPLSSIGYATYSLTVILPKNRPELALEIPDAYCAYTLFVNGKVFSASGKVGTSRDNSEPHWISATKSLHVSSDTLQLVLHVSNFWHTRGGTYKNILIGDRENLMLDRYHYMAFDSVLAGFLFMGGLYFFSLFLFGRHDKAILYFALFSMSYSYRLIGTDTYTLHTLLPNIDWIITLRLEYASLFISIALFVQYIKHLYPEDINRIFIQICLWLCTIFALCSLTLSPRLFTYLINPFLVLMFIYIGYAFIIYIKAVRKNRVGSIYALISTGLVTMVFLLINLDYFGIVVPEKSLLFFGYVTYFLLQSQILSYRFAHELKSAKEQAEQGLRAKSQFLSTMSHEIRTPLNSVIGMTHFLIKNDPRSDQIKNLNVLLFSANNLLGIVNNILDFNKIEADKITFEKIEVDLVALCRNIIAGLKIAAEDKGIALELNVDDAITRKVIGDPIRMTQVITNLVHNAIKFTHAGSVMLSLRVVRQTHDALELKVSVQDTGIGIPKEKQKIIFERFTQADSSTSRRYGGTGLGLAISKKILELLGSELHLISEPGKGSEFFFTLVLPAGNAVVETVNPQQQQKTEEKPLQGVHILLVDDNPINILVAQNFLKKWGAVIDTAKNGQEAIDQLDVKKHHLILMDLHMPVMDGYEATRRLRSRGETIPIIALTASIPQEVEDQVKKAGLNGTVIKPFVPDDLLRVVLHFLHKRKV